MVRKIKRKTRRDACARFVVRKGEKKKRACGAFSDGAKEEKSGKSFQNIQKKRKKEKPIVMRRRLLNCTACIYNNQQASNGISKERKRKEKSCRNSIGEKKKKRSTLEKKKKSGEPVTKISGKRLHFRSRDGHSLVSPVLLHT